MGLKLAVTEGSDGEMEITENKQWLVLPTALGPVPLMTSTVTLVVEAAPTLTFSDAGVVVIELNFFAANARCGIAMMVTHAMTV